MHLLIHNVLLVSCGCTFEETRLFNVVLNFVKQFQVQCTALRIVPKGGFSFETSDRERKCEEKPEMISRSKTFIRTSTKY